MEAAHVISIDGLEREINPQEYVAEIVRRSKSSFYWPMILLPKEKREAIEAVYAFCRTIDDIVDTRISREKAVDKLGFFQSEIEAIYGDDETEFPTHPVTMALMFHVRKFGLPKEYFLNIISGCRMDLGGDMLKPDLKTLDEYSYDVASSVGLLLIEIFGYENENTKDFAIELGKAMQLVNIIRDVHEDAKAGRIYLPRECLEPRNLGDMTVKDLLRDPYSPSLHLVYEELTRMARIYIDRAMQKLMPEDRTNMRPALFMLGIYETYLDEMEKRFWYFRKSDLDLSFLEKMKIFLEVANH